mgnify:FL=1
MNRRGLIASAIGAAAAPLIAATPAITAGGRHYDSHEALANYLRPGLWSLFLNYPNLQGDILFSKGHNCLFVCIWHIGYDKPEDDPHGIDFPVNYSELWDFSRHTYLALHYIATKEPEAA